MEQHAGEQQTIALSTADYKRLTDWAASHEFEQFGIIATKKEGSKIMPIGYVLSDKFVKKATSTFCQCDDLSVAFGLGLVQQCAVGPLVLIHTHPGRGAVSMASPTDMQHLSRWAEWGARFGQDILLGVAASSSVSFFECVKEETKYLHMEIDGQFFNPKRIFIQAEQENREAQIVKKLRTWVAGRLGTKQVTAQHGTYTNFLSEMPKDVSDEIKSFMVNTYGEGKTGDEGLTKTGMSVLAAFAYYMKYFDEE